MASDGDERQRRQAAREGNLRARPGGTRGREEGHAAALSGVHHLGLDGARDGLLYVPEGYRAGYPLPLALMLHGAGGNAHQGLALLRALADPTGMILLAVDSRGSTWDVIYHDYGPDVAFIDRALALTFDRYAIDPAHVAVGGFSDGASYALSLGIGNGSLFTHVLAFSPGFVMPLRREGSPRFYVAHERVTRCCRWTNAAGRSSRS